MHSSQRVLIVLMVSLPVKSSGVGFRMFPDECGLRLVSPVEELSWVLLRCPSFASSESFSRLTCQMADVSAGGPISEGLMTPQVLQKHLREIEVYKCEEAAGGADFRLVYTNHESSTTM